MPVLSEYIDELLTTPLTNNAYETSEFAQLSRWVLAKLGVQSTSVLTLPARVAPSFVTRCESEFLNLSAPRFAVRLEHAELGYINLRRLGEIEKMFRSRANSEGGDRVSSQLRPRGTIADAMIRTASFKGKFHCLTVPAECGSSEGSRDPLCPYVGQLDSIGGGECAECVVMMVTQIMHRYVRRVHGVAEVNASLLPPYLDLLNASGLTIDAIVAYLTDDRSGPGGLSASIQLPQPLLDTALENRHNLFRSAVDIYIKSGFPVILPVDLTQMNKGFCRSFSSDKRGETGIYQANNIPEVLQRAWRHDQISRPHAVLAVGTKTVNSLSPLQNSSDHHFLINDPATVPFLTASASAIKDAIATRNSAHTDLENSQDLCFIPVVPAAVRMTLHPSKPRVGDRIDKISAVELAYVCQRLLPGAPNTILGLIHDTTPQFQFGAFRLISVNEWLANRINESFYFPDGRSDSETEVPEWLLKNEIPGVLEELRRRGVDWTWIHYKASTPRCVVFYDAQCDFSWSELHGEPDYDAENGFNIPQLLEGLSKGLVGCISETRNGKWVFTGLRGEIPTPAIVSAPTTRSHPSRLPRDAFQLGVINSFDAECRFTDGDHLWWPNEELYCEFYCFMQSMISRWMKSGLRQLTKEQRVDAVSLLGLCDSDEQIREFVAAQMLATYQRAVKLYGLASFFQELSSDEEGASRRGRFALRGLLRLAVQIKKSGHPVRVVEAVCGSRVQSVSRLQSVFVAERSHSPFSQPTVATLRSSTVGARRLIQNIRQSLSPDIVADLLKYEIRIALECEPGPLNVVNSATALWDLLQQISSTTLENNVPLERIVALNLDVSHYRQAEIPHTVVLELCERSKFTHVHLSGFDPKGHFGDQMFIGGEVQVYEGVFEQMSKDLLKDCRQIGVSLEFEAAGTKELVGVASDRFLQCFTPTNQ